MVLNKCLWTEGTAFRTCFSKGCTHVAVSTWDSGGALMADPHPGPYKPNRYPRRPPQCALQPQSVSPVVPKDATAQSGQDPWRGPRHGKWRHQLQTQVPPTLPLLLSPPPPPWQSANTDASPPTVQLTQACKGCISHPWPPGAENPQGPMFYEKIRKLIRQSSDRLHSFFIPPPKGLVFLQEKRKKTYPR